MLPNKAPHNNSKVLYQYDYEIMISIAPQKGETGDYVSEFPPMYVLESIMFYH